MGRQNKWMNGQGDDGWMSGWVAMKVGWKENERVNNDQETKYSQFQEHNLGIGPQLVSCNVLGDLLTDKSIYHTQSPKQEGDLEGLA